MTIDLLALFVFFVPALLWWLHLDSERQTRLTRPRTVKDWNDRMDLIGKAMKKAEDREIEEKRKTDEKDYWDYVRKTGSYV